MTWSKTALYWRYCSLALSHRYSITFVSLIPHHAEIMGWDSMLNMAGIILGMRSANERRRYIVTSSRTGRAPAQNDPHVALIAAYSDLSGVTQILQLYVCTIINQIWLILVHTLAFYKHADFISRSWHERDAPPVHWPIEALTKWSLNCSQHFQIHFLKEELLYLIQVC